MENKTLESYIWLEQKCTRCKRIVNRKQDHLEGGTWEILEEYDTFKRICWVCKCKDDKGKRHTEVVKDILEHGCGC